MTKNIRISTSVSQIFTAELQLTDIFRSKILSMAAPYSSFPEKTETTFSVRSFVNEFYFFFFVQAYALRLCESQTMNERNANYQRSAVSIYPI